MGAGVGQGTVFGSADLRRTPREVERHDIARDGQLDADRNLDRLKAVGVAAILAIPDTVRQARDLLAEPMFPVIEHSLEITGPYFSAEIGKNRPKSLRPYVNRAQHRAEIALEKVGSA